MNVYIKYRNLKHRAIEYVTNSCNIQIVGLLWCFHEVYSFVITKP
jgi:hypothetical protein